MCICFSISSDRLAGMCVSATAGKMRMPSQRIRFLWSQKVQNPQKRKITRCNKCATALWHSNLPAHTHTHICIDARSNEVELIYMRTAISCKLPQQQWKQLLKWKCKECWRLFFFALRFILFFCLKSAHTVMSEGDFVCCLSGILICFYARLAN